MIKVKVDASKVSQGYTNAFKLLRQLTGFDQRKALRGEMGIILKAWALRTKVAKPSEINLRARYMAGKRAFGGRTSMDKNPYGITVNTGARGGFPGEVWFRTPSGKFQQAGKISNSGKYTPSWIHWKKDAWTKIKAGASYYGDQLAYLLPVGKRSAGLARQSVIQIADSLQIDLSRVQGVGISEEGIIKARSAIASNGQAYRNGTGSEAGDEVRYYVHALNRLPYGIRAGMDRALAGVLSGRAKYIAESYKKGAFASLATAAKAFPNMITLKN